MPGIENLEPAPDGYEERIGRIAQLLALELLEPCQRLVHLLVHGSGQPGALVKGVAGLGRDGKPRRHGHAALVISARPEPLPPRVSFMSL